MPSTGRVWVTGGTGFFGSHIVRRLGARALVTTRKEVDLLDFEQVQGFLSQHEVGSIVHAAAFVGGIQFHAAHPGRMASDNLRMGLNLLEAAKQAQGIHVVLISTACAYADSAPIPTPESELHRDAPSGPTGPYGTAKRRLHVVAEGLRRESGLSYVALIPTNLYGPRDHFDEERSHVVPALLKRAQQAKAENADELVVWGDGTQTRDFLYVGDAAEAVELALDRRHSGESFNLSSGRETSIRELAETIGRVVEFEGRLVFDPTKPGGSPRRALDPTKAAEVLGFRARTELEDGIRKTVDWLEKR